VRVLGRLEKTRIEEVLRLLWKIEELKDVNDLTRLLRK
jgi:hypothetical protein